MPADQNEISSQWLEARNLLEKWYERARINQLQHYEAAKYYSTANNAIGIPVVVLSSVVGTTVFATLQKQVEVGIQIAVGALSVLAAVLAALQTFLRYSERAERHRSSAATYAAVRHRLEAVTNIPVSLRPPLKELLDSIEGQIDSLAQSAPNVPDKVWRRVKALKSEKHFEPMIAAGGRAAVTDFVSARVPAAGPDPHSSLGATRMFAAPPAARPAGGQDPPAAAGDPYRP